MTDLTVVMVTRNEAAAVRLVIEDIRRHAPSANIIIVDSSEDQTPAIATELGCEVIRQWPPRGYGPALGAGLRSAKTDVVITMDCDHTYPASAIPEMLEKLHTGFDVVSASRMGKRHATMPYANHLANRLFAWLAGVLCGVRTTDVHTGMRAYRAEIFKTFQFDENGMALPVELLIGPSQQGFKITEIFIDYKERLGKSTLEPLPGTIWTLRRLWRFRRIS